MYKTNDARFEAMMEHYRNEMLRYQRATPPGEETLTEKLKRAEKIKPPVCHNCMTAESVPEVKSRPLPPGEETSPPPTEEIPLPEPNIEEPEAEEITCEEVTSEEESSPLPETECVTPTEEPEAVEAINIPLRWQIFFPNMPRPRPVPPMPRPPRPQPPRPNPPRPQPFRPDPPTKKPQPQPPMQKPQPRQPQPLIPAMQVAAVDAADRLLDAAKNDFDTLVDTLTEKFSSLDDGTLTRVLSVISRNDPDLAAAVSKAMNR